MALLRCTRKLLKELAVEPSEPVDPGGVAGSWHANLFRVERRKCVLFTDDATLYSVFVPGLRKPQLQRIGDVFGQALFRSLRLAGFSQRQIERVLEAIDGKEGLRIARTNDRSVLGSMNDLAFNIEWMIAAGGGLRVCSLDEINRAVNRIPMRAIRPHVFSVDALRAALGGPAR